jgi:hypothetical protein
MEPPLQTAPRRAEGTRFSASSSSPSLCEESRWGSVIRAQGRQFPAPVAMLLLRFRPPPSILRPLQPHVHIPGEKANLADHFSVFLLPSVATPSFTDVLLCRSSSSTRYGPIAAPPPAPRRFDATAPSSPSSVVAKRRPPAAPPYCSIWSRLCSIFRARHLLHQVFSFVSLACASRKWLPCWYELMQYSYRHDLKLS